MIRVERASTESVIAAYRLDDKAEAAVECMATMDHLCRSIRRAFGKQGRDGEKGLPEAERLIVQSHAILRAETMRRWYLGEAEATAERKSDSITGANCLSQFNW